MWYSRYVDTLRTGGQQLPEMEGGSWSTHGSVLVYWECYERFFDNMECRWGTRHIWLRHCAKSRKVVVSIPSGVSLEFFIDIIFLAALWPCGPLSL